MRNMNCRTVRREIEETGPGELLSVAAREHLATCNACETLSQQQAKLQTIISSLGTVEAPGDFDFRLRARLTGERRGNSQVYALGNFSFGVRAAAVATVLLLLGSAFVFVTFRTRPNSPKVVAVVPANYTPVPGSDRSNGSLQPVEKQPVEGTDVVQTGIKPPDREVLSSRKRIANDAVATRGNNRDATRELAGSQAPVIKPLDSSAETYPTEAFPINASYQSLRVSVDDGRGTSRTISLPTVSFGSQKALSQSASPLLASARGVW